MADGRTRRASGELETEVLAALWTAGRALTAGEVREALDQRLAYNTVQTILVRLHDKNLVERSSAGRAHAYRAMKNPEDLAAARMHEQLAHGLNHEAVLQSFVGSLSKADERALRTMLGRLDP
ncbi:BlaI/MecI/CopY family transcriptional regulator [Solihabitans fulvus]|uniref:BlaI/MecI/CopY family transcriptional regulator n=1 Tax=Solihabitans fulvus TaxID=1892852 RepID=UPI001CB75E9C|nr:BlaI/MecI/CopY family transcriptional regulator [Solihabitans fulvus]